MVEKSIKEIYDVDTISQDKGWKKIRETVAEIDDDITIDFSSVTVVEPWQCPEFKQLLRDKRVYLKFVNNAQLVGSIRAMCLLDGLGVDHVINVEVEVPKEKTAEEKKTENIGNEIKTFFKLYDNEYVFKVSDRYSSMHNNSTLRYIDFAIRELFGETGVKDYILDMNDVSVTISVLSSLANMIVDDESLDIHIKVDTDDEEVIKNLGLSIHIATNSKYDTTQRFKTIKKSLKKNTAGMLIKYKKSKALDEFGRHGKGEVLSSKLAVFRGFKLDSGSAPLMLVEVFNDNYFYTRQHWMIEHDNEVPSRLHSELLEIELDEIGFCDVFLGSQYHFILPVQQSKKENRMVISHIDENGKNVKKMCTIPERMKIVFDDWGVTYDKESLEKSIKDTQELLSTRDE